METKQIKLLLKLLGEPDYQAQIKSVKPTSKTPISECNRICYQLRDRDLIEITESEILKIKITSSGKALLNIDPSELPLTQKELKIVKVCNSGSLKPTQIKVSPATERDNLIDGLIARGFITVTQAKPQKITLTEAGKTFLMEEFKPSGTNAVLSFNMLSNYLTFLRKYQPDMKRANPDTTKPKHHVSDEEILTVIHQLDQEHNTNNYLPIFYLREQLQPPLTREELDQSLYRLQSHDQIQLSSLTETDAYSSEQLKAGISQPIGGSLFFIQVNR